MYDSVDCGAPIPPRLEALLPSIAEGLSDRELAARHWLAEHTVHNYVSALMHRLDCGRTELVRRAQAPGALTVARTLDAKPAWRMPPRLRRLLPLLAEGATNEQLSAQLRLSKRTVAHYIADIMRATDCPHRIRLVVVAQSLLPSQQCEEFEP